MTKKQKKIPNLGTALKDLDVPFDLLAGFTLVIEELKSKTFYFSEISKDDTTILTFNSKELQEKILINIDKENLLIRQFSILEDNRRKLKVIYVVKPSERAFKLV